MGDGLGCLHIKRSCLWITCINIRFFKTDFCRLWLVKGATSLAYTVASFSSALFGVIWGILADKYGTRWFGLIGAAAMTTCLYLLSAQDSLFEFYLLYFLFGALGSALLFSPLYANVGFWFRENPGLALGIAASGGAIGQAFIPHLSGYLINSSGWQSAYISLAFIYLQ